MGAPGDWGHILKQIGMFSFTGLTKVGGRLELQGGCVREAAGRGQGALASSVRPSVTATLPGPCPCRPRRPCLLSTTLPQAQVENMTAKWHVYMTMDGRISMAGLSGTSDSSPRLRRPPPRLLLRCGVHARKAVAAA